MSHKWKDEEFQKDVLAVFETEIHDALWPIDFVRGVNGKHGAVSKDTVVNALRCLEMKGLVNQVGNFWYLGPWQENIRSYKALLNEAWNFITKNHDEDSWPKMMKKLNSQMKLKGRAALIEMLFGNDKDDGGL